MKILINLQAGSVRVSELRNTLCIRFKGSVGARFTWKPSRWSIPLCRWRLPLGRLTGGICSTRIDFQLGTNAADSNELNGRREALKQNNCHALLTRWVMGPFPTIGRRSGKRLGQGFAKVIPRKCLQNAPKKRIDITAVKVLVHISCADCNRTVIHATTPVGACIENLSQ